MADNYLENKYEALQLRRDKEKKARQAAWKKRMDAYRKKLEMQEGKEGRQESAGKRIGTGIQKKSDRKTIRFRSLFINGKPNFHFAD